MYGNQYDAESPTASHRSSTLFYKLGMIFVCVPFHSIVSSSAKAHENWNGTNDKVLKQFFSFNSLTCAPAPSPAPAVVILSKMNLNFL